MGIGDVASALLCSRPLSNPFSCTLPSDASEKCSLSESAVPAVRHGKGHMGGHDVPSSFAPGSSISTLLRGGASSSAMLELAQGVDYV